MATNKNTQHDHFAFHDPDKDSAQELKEPPAYAPWPKTPQRADEAVECAVWGENEVYRLRDLPDDKEQ